MENIRDNKILFYSFFLIFVINIGIMVIGPLIPEISMDLNVGLDIMGTAISLSILGVLITSLITGNFLELFGFKKVIIFGSLLGIFGIIGLYFSYNFYFFLISFFILRLSEGVLLVSILSLIGTIYQRERTSNIVKIAIASILARVVSPLLVCLISLVTVDWREIFLYIGIIFVFLFIYLFMLKIPIGIRGSKSADSLFKINRKIFSSSYFVVCFFIIFFHSGIMGTFYTWFTLYFSDLGVGLDKSPLFLSIYSLSIVIGLLLKNKLAKRVKEKIILIFSFIFSLVMLLPVFFIDSLLLKNILIFLFGIGISGNFAITYSIGIGLYPDYANFTSSILVSSSYFGAMVFQYLTGFFSENYSKSSVLHINNFLLFVLVIISLLFNSNRKLNRDIKSFIKSD